MCVCDFWYLSARLDSHTQEGFYFEAGATGKEDSEMRHAYEH